MNVDCEANEQRKEIGKHHFRHLDSQTKSQEQECKDIYRHWGISLLKSTLLKCVNSAWLFSSVKRSNENSLLINCKTANCLIKPGLLVHLNPACENSVGLCWPSLCLSLQHNASALRGGIVDASFSQGRILSFHWLQPNILFHSVYVSISFCDILAWNLQKTPSKSW